MGTLTSLPSAMTTIGTLAQARSYLSFTTMQRTAHRLSLRIAMRLTTASTSISQTYKPKPTMLVFPALALNSLIIMGIHVLTRHGMLLQPFVNDDWNEYIRKPLYDCPPCMSSVWGILGWLYFAPDFNIILYLLALCGLNGLLSAIFYLTWEHTNE